MTYYSALHYAAKAEKSATSAAKSAEAAADSATQASQASGKIIQVGFDGTLANGVLTFKHAPGGVEVPYNLQDDFEYELDLAFANTANLPTNTQMVIKNGNDTIRFVSALHRDATTNATVADMDAVMRFNSGTGYRWLFKASYKVTPSGAKVFLLYPVVAKEDTTKITNCITEIPQDIKLELVDGVLTLKAGSKVYVPNGAGKFDEVLISADKTITTNNGGVVFINSANQAPNVFNGNLLFSGSTTPTGFSSNAVWYNTTNNVIKNSSNAGSSWENLWSFPIARVSASNGTITSIDQVFNGFGYIGSTVFALPGVKGLIPNGRNADGSLKNIEFTVSKVSTVQAGSTSAGYIGFVNGTLMRRYSGNSVYDESKNIWYNPETGNSFQFLYCGDFSITSAKITSFTPKLPFRAVDYNDFQQLASNIFSAGNIGDIKYTSRTDVPNGGAWCDGALYTKAQFPDVYQMLVAGKLQSITVSAFDSSVSANGSCGFFGLDTANERFKVPLLKDVYIKAGQAGEMFGAESLPNIKGLLTLAGTLPVASATETSSATGAFYGDGKDTAQKHDASSFIGGAGKFGFNASRSSSTYKDNAKVNPDHVTYRAYVVLYSSATEASVTQAAEFMTALGGKVNVNLDNVASNIDYVVSSGKVSNGGWVIWKSGRIEQWGRVDYPSGVASGTNYTITLHKPYTSNYSLATDYVLEPSGWGKYSTVSRSLTNFAFRLDSSSGNLQASLRSFSWYTTGF